VIGQGRVLLVEDQHEVRSLLVDALGDRGWQVLAADDGRQALELFDAQRDGIDIVVTDVAMPAMDGNELARAIAAQRPELPVLFITGYLESSDDLPRGAGRDVLTKPFTARELSRKMLELLDGRRG